MGTKKQMKKLYTLENPTWLNKAGMSKGIHHDRQHLGIILAAGSHLKIRRVEGDDKAMLNLRLLNADKNLEKSAEFGTEWLDISNDSPSVPFVDTPLGTIPTKVEYEYDPASKILPIYKKFDSEGDFFTQWDKSSAEFALIESDYVIILVPAGDKEALRKLKGVPNINAVIDYFDRVFTFYNQLAGLSFNPHLECDRNIGDRYFLKADVHGAGGAYYGNSYSAATSPSIAGWWLNCVDSNWGNLHEIAHGYQGGFMSTPGFSAGEVWNNVYAASFQNVHLGEKIWKDGWLFDFGKSDQVFETIKTCLREETPLDSWGLRSKLIFVMLLINRGGVDAFTHLNQKYRKHSNDLNFNPDRFTLLDMLAAAYSRIAKIDTTAFMLRVGGILSEEQIEKNRLFHEKVVYPLCELVKPDALATVQAELGMKNPFTLVDPSELKRTGLVGDLSVNIDIDKFPEIYGETFTLMEGQRYAFNVKIKERTFKIPNIPIGVYTMILPTGKSVKYAIDKYYAVVKQGTNDLKLTYTPKGASPLQSVAFNFLGLSNYKFGSVKIDYLRKMILIAVTEESPHSYFEGKTYVQVTVKSPEGTVLFDKVIQGTKAIVSKDQVPFKDGYQLVIFHAEIDRLRPLVPTDAILLTKEKTNTFTLTDGGISNNALGTKPNYIKGRVESAAEEARQNLRIIRAEYDRRKDDIYLALKNYPNEAERAELLLKYKDVLPKHNETPGPNVGSAFLVTYLGYSHVEFLRVKLDFVRAEMTLEVKAVTPHGGFGDRLYAAIRLLDSNGVERLNKDFPGKVRQNASNMKIPLSYHGGEQLFLHHLESPTRLRLVNEMQDMKIPVGRNSVFRFVPTGIELVYESTEEKDDPPSLYNSI